MAGAEIESHASPASLLLAALAGLRWVHDQADDCWRLMKDMRCLAVVRRQRDGTFFWYGVGKSSAGRIIRDREQAMAEAFDYAKRTG